MQKTTRSAKNILGAPLYIRLKPDELARVERHACFDSRSRASFLRVIVLKGLALHESELDAAAIQPES